MKKALILAGLLICSISLNAAVKTTFNNSWKFALGSAESMEKDFTHGTEYFTYICKAASTGHNKGPANPAFDDSVWQSINLPHDWVVDLPFSGEASHSHGYKCIGWKYPENSVGWYRKEFSVPAEWEGERLLIEFEGVYRASQVFCNGFYLGGRDDGYLHQIYDLTDYVDYGSDKNVISVRCDASLEEGWYYEGAGIYRNVYLIRTPQVAALQHGVKTLQSYEGKDVFRLDITVSTTAPAKVENFLLDAEGKLINKSKGSDSSIKVKAPHRWDVSDPYLYTLLTVVDGKDSTLTDIGFRTAEFSSEQGFVLNGRKLILKGCNLHQDHAGVGSALPDELIRYRLETLRKYGFNAIRSSHNPASPALLNLCDKLGFLIIDENREFGDNPRQLNNLKDMILRDINHPSVIIWSIGNEEWALESSPKGETIARKMCEFARSVDPSRLCTYGSSGGWELVKGADVFGYNYIVQNPVEEYHERFPEKTCIGTEETSGAGTRGEWRTVVEEGWMQPLNRRDTAGVVNAIERGWKFYAENKWTCGLFYWTGFDYRGEPNPMLWPATGSQFGILDYCGYPKDEAWYLKSWWLTDEPCLHICSPANGQVWVYSNCSEVELFADGISLGRKNMPLNGHLSWNIESEGPFTAVGTHDGKQIRAVFPDFPQKTGLTLSKDILSPDGQDVIVVDIESPLAELKVEIKNATLLGWGNGNPGFKEVERPLNGENTLTVKPFNGRCQILIRSIEGSEEAAVLTAGDLRKTIRYSAAADIR